MTAVGLPNVLTIGHSSHPWENFIELLRGAGVTAVADVRTSPFSRFNPHFNREEMREKLSFAGISYVFLGKELGGRPSDQKFYSDGVVDYEKVAKSDEFNKGLDRVVEGAKKYRIAVMCSENNPIDCHRCLLVGRALAEREVSVQHILSSGAIVNHVEIEDELLQLARCEAEDLFVPRVERLAAAYRDRARKVAFAEPKSDVSGSIAMERRA
jgi:uncharacterized protein (DUF488 family)